MPFTPSEPRHTVEDTGDGLCITVPAPKRRYAILAMGFGLIWVVVIAPFVFRSFLSPSYNGESWFPVAVIAVFTLALLYAVISLLWLLFGVEVTKVDRDGIKTRRQVFGLGRTRNYDGEHIRRLRAALIVYATTYRSNFTWEYLGLAGGQIAFDYGAKTIRFGGGIDEAEARTIVEAITQRFHRFQRK